MTAPTIPITTALAYVDGFISEEGRKLHRFECDHDERRAERCRYAIGVLRALRSELLSDAGVEESDL
jgi:hypothetical protein